MRNILNPLPTDKFPLFHATGIDAKGMYFNPCNIFFANSSNMIKYADEERLEGSTISRRRTVSAGPSLTDAFAPPVPFSEQSFKEVIFQNKHSTVVRDIHS